MAEKFKINGTDFDCEFIIRNEKGEDVISFTKSAIKGLDLEENLFEPFNSANVVIQNAFDFIENKNLTRGDGRDYFYFSFKNSQASDEDKLEYEFVINGEQNSTSKTDRSNNFKIYKLLDTNYFKLNEPIPYGTRFRGYIGDIIKEIIIDKIGEEFIDEENFEPGDHAIDILPEHIIPPTSFRYSDLIKYLLRINYNIVDGLSVRSLLRFDRLSKKYSLLPITKIFSKNKDLTQEGFTAGDLINNFKANSNNPPPDAQVNVLQTPLFNTDFTTPMLTYSNGYFMNFLASGYDPILGEHGIREVRIKDIKDKWKEKFVDVFKSTGGKPKPFLPLNKVKKEKLFRTFSFPFSLDKTRNIAEAEMTSNITFYNLQLNINNLGDTKRTSGKFIDIYRRDEEKDVDKKIIGRWLVTKCRHKFTYDSYYNTLQCIKTYVGPDAEFDDDIE